jgi:hypothetical protein
MVRELDAKKTRERRRTRKKKTRPPPHLLIDHGLSLEPTKLTWRTFLWLFLCTLLIYKSPKTANRLEHCRSLWFDNQPHFRSCRRNSEFQILSLSLFPPPELTAIFDEMNPPFITSVAVPESQMPPPEPLLPRASFPMISQSVKVKGPLSPVLDKPPPRMVPVPETRLSLIVQPLREAIP